MTAIPSLPALKASDPRRHLLHIFLNGDYSLAELSKELDASIPTVTKFVGDLIEKGYVADLGKHDTSGGRRPSYFGLNPSAGYIAGVEVGRDCVNLIITDFKGRIADSREGIPFVLQSGEASFIQLTQVILEEIEKTGIPREEILTYGITLSGRVDARTGYCYTYFISEGEPVTTLLASRLGVPVFIENDSRAMTYGEYSGGVVNGEENVLFINASWGLGMGMVIDGRLSYGKSGFSGEIGHFPLLNNNQLCQCGKRECLETGASVSAARRMIIQRMEEGQKSTLAAVYATKKDLGTADILDAIRKEDVLTIEVVEEIGQTLGRAIAGLINIFNPELVVIGGALAVAGDYIMLPIKSAINKYSLNLVSRDTSVKFSRLGTQAGPFGACLLARARLLGMM